METNPTPQPSDVGEVVEQIEKLLYRNSACAMLYCTYPIGKHSDNCPVPAVLAAVRTLAGELDAMIAANTELGAQLVDARGDAYNMAKQLTDAQARVSRMRVELEIANLKLTKADVLLDSGVESSYREGYSQGQLGNPIKEFPKCGRLAVLRECNEKIAELQTALAGAGEGKG